MAWTYHCADENMNISASTKEELAAKLMEHMGMQHDKDITMQQAIDMVEQNAKQAAA